MAFKEVELQVVSSTKEKPTSETPPFKANELSAFCTSLHFFFDTMPKRFLRQIAPGRRNRGSGRNVGKIRRNPAQSQLAQSIRLRHNL
jgi:hypothetical protein